MAEPHYSFTIPSVYDDTPLNCRIYHPDVLSRPQTAQYEGTEPWRKKGILMAHPYAPMGGSYDDRVVGMVVDEFLKMGWIVATFNFRGAHGSKGRTSWSGKPELDDYLSVAGLFMHYLSYIHPFPTPDTAFTTSTTSTTDDSPVSSHTERSQAAPSRSDEAPIVILGGYSYGSLILKHLPPVPSILHPFAAPISGSAASEILLRAHKLADQSTLEWINLARDRDRRKNASNGTATTLSVTMGGEETSPEKRRSSREIRRSMDGGGHRSLDLGRRMRSLSHRRRKDDDALAQADIPPEKKAEEIAIIMPDVRYLLISPLTPPVSTCAAMGLGHKFWARGREGSGEVIGKHKALAIFGDQDVFSSAKKTRDWAERLREESRERFSAVEIAGAGHFWHEHGVEGELRATLRAWGGQVGYT